MFNAINDVNSAVEIEESVERDSLGGSTRESDVYDATVDSAYLLQAESGAISVNVIYNLADGSTFKQTEFITNKKGETFYTKEGKNLPLPGFSKVNSLTLCAINVPLKDFNDDVLDVKVINLYDRETKREMPTEVQMITPLLGVKLKLGILKVNKNKQVKNTTTGQYDNTNDMVTLNEISKYFDENGLTVTEREAGNEEPKFLNDWLKKNKDTVLDLFKPLEGVAKATGGAKSSSMFAKKAAETTEDAPKKTLFGKK